MANLSNKIRQLAEEKGIDIVRITYASPFEEYNLTHLQRRDPRLTLPEAHSIIIFGIYIGGFSLPQWDNPEVGRTSRLFLSGFTRDVVEPLESISCLLHDYGYKAVICDTLQPESSILPLKLAALRAGIGWQGKNTLLISPYYGSFLALGGIVTEALLDFDNKRVEDRCGKCHACQDACPMGALDEPYQLERERCLSYLLEKEILSEEAYQIMGNQIIECEICQIVCPWNKKHLNQPLQTKRVRSFGENIDKLSEFFKLSNLFRLSEQDYKEFIRPYRTDVPYRIFRRNVVAALSFSKQPDSILALHAALEDEDPEIRRIAKNSWNFLKNLRNKE